MKGNQDVLDDGHVAEQADVLERSGNAAGRNLLRCKARNVGTAPAHPPGSRRQDPGDHVENGRLTRAIGPDEADQLAGAERERKVIHCRKAAELHQQLFKSQEYIHADHRPSVQARPNNEVSRQEDLCKKPQKLF